MCSRRGKGASPRISSSCRPILESHLSIDFQNYLHYAFQPTTKTSCNRRNNQNHCIERTCLEKHCGKAPCLPEQFWVYPTYFSLCRLDFHLHQASCQSGNWRTSAAPSAQMNTNIQLPHIHTTNWIPLEYQSSRNTPDVRCLC